MIIPDHLSEGGLDPFKDIHVHRIVNLQGEGASEELRDNLGDGRTCP